MAQCNALRGGHFVCQTAQSGRIGVGHITEARAEARIVGAGAVSYTHLDVYKRQVLDLAGEERAGMTVDALLEKFRTSAGKELGNDRILLSDRE